MCPEVHAIGVFVSAEVRSRIEEKKRMLDALRPLPPDALERLSEQMKLELTYHSNAIEGNTLTLKETRLVVLEGITIGGKSTREHLEAINHAEAFDVLAGKIEAASINLVDLLEIHEIVMRGIGHTAGQWRQTHVRIAGMDHRPPPPEKVLGLMIEFERDLVERGRELNDVDFASWAHHRLAHIHPFEDGNGRTARLLQNLILMQRGYPPAVILRGDRPRYYRTLGEADRGNLGPFADFVARSVERGLNLYLEAFKGSEFELIPLSQAAEEVPYSQEYLSLLARRGLLGAVKLGRNWHTSRRDLQRYLEQHGRIAR
jgi:Fic family protein